MISDRNRSPQNHLRIAVQCSMFLPIAIYVSVLVHELAHGVVGWLVGGKFVGMYCSLFSRSCAFVIFPPDASPFAHLAMLSAGVVISMFLGVICLFCVCPDRARLARQARPRECFGGRMFCLLLSGALSLSSAFYLLLGGFFGGDDVAKVANIASIPLSVFRFIGLAGLLPLTYFLFVALFRFIGWYLPVTNFAERFKACASTLFAPMAFSAMVASVATHSINRFALGAVAATLTACLVASAVVRMGTQRARRNAVPLRPCFSGILGLACVLALWLGVFGPQPKRAKGLVWSPPPENEIQSCNIHVSIKNDISSIVTFRMRPFPTTADLLWRKIKGAEPMSWGAYEAFVREAVPNLLATDCFSITQKRADAQTPFFVGHSTNGARVIVVEAELSAQIITGNRHVFGSPFTDGASSRLSVSSGPAVSRIRITDFWKAHKAGYIDRIAISFEKDVRLLDYQTIPQEKRALVQRLGSDLILENADMNGPDAIVCWFLCESPEFNPRESLASNARKLPAFSSCESFIEE